MTATSGKSTPSEEAQSKKRKEAGRVIDRESSSLRGKNSKITTPKNKIKPWPKTTSRSEMCCFLCLSSAACHFTRMITRLWNSSRLRQKKTTDRDFLLYCSFCCFFCLPVCVRLTRARLCQYLSSGIFCSTSEQVPSFILGRWLCSERLVVCGLMSCCRVFHQNRQRYVLVFSTAVCVGGTKKKG